MRVYILTDMEGVAGVVNSQDYSRPGCLYYDVARELTTLEVNAAIEGAMAAGATEFLVVDGHGPGAMDPRLLHPKAKLLIGRPMGFPFCCDESFDACFIVGQHAMTNTDGGHLCHTGSFPVETKLINGNPVGELACVALCAGQFNVPTVLVSGDLAACREAEALIPGVVTAPVKEGLKRGVKLGMTGEEARAFNGAAIHLQPEVARNLIREKAKEAVSLVGQISPVKFKAPYEMVTVFRPEQAGGGYKIRRSRANDIVSLLNSPDETIDERPERYLGHLMN